MNFISYETPHAHLHYNHTLYARSEKDPLQTVGVVDYTNSIKNCLKWLSLKGCISVKKKSPSKLHMYISTMPIKSISEFQKYPLETVEGVDYTNSIPDNAKSCPK